MKWERLSIQGPHIINAPRTSRTSPIILLTLLKNHEKRRPKPGYPQEKASEEWGIPQILNKTHALSHSLHCCRTKCSGFTVLFH